MCSEGYNPTSVQSRRSAQEYVQNWHFFYHPKLSMFFIISVLACQ